MTIAQRRIVTFTDRAFRFYERGLEALRIAAVEDLKRRLQDCPIYSPTQPSPSRRVRKCGKVHTAS